LLPLTKYPAGGFWICGISAKGSISYALAWWGWRFVTGSHSFPPWPLRTSHGGAPLTVPACKSSRTGTSPEVK